VYTRASYVKLSRVILGLGLNLAIEKRYVIAGYAGEKFEI